METLQRDIQGVQERLDRLNDRTRLAEQTIAVLHDRATPGHAAAWGGGVGGVIVALTEAVKWLMQPR